MKPSILLLVVVVCYLFSGLSVADGHHNSTHLTENDSNTSRDKNESNQSSWFANAIIIGMDLKKQTLMLEHTAVEGLMPAMTMPFNAPDLSFENLSKGDLVNFEFEMQGSQFYIKTLIVLKKNNLSNSFAKETDINIDIPWDFQLTNQNANPMKLAQYKGKKLLVNFIYTSCPTVCPVQTAHLNNLYQQLSSTEQNNLQLLSISIDPETDQPAQLTEFMTKMHIETKNWDFLTGDKMLIKRIANRFNTIAIRQSDGELDHWIGLHLISPEGKPIKTYSGLELDIDEIRKDIMSL